MLENEISPTIKPDTDNIAKSILDSLNGIAYKDDKQIIRLTVEKWYAEVPNVTVEIKEVWIMFYLGILIGFICGMFFGIFTMCLLQISKED